MDVPKFMSSNGSAVTKYHLDSYREPSLAGSACCEYWSMNLKERKEYYSVQNKGLGLVQVATFFSETLI